MKNIHANPVGKISKDIYIIKNNINDKVYIGQSIDAENRFKSHCKKSSESLLKNAIQEYGKQNFWYEILEENVENPDDREKYWIKYYNSITPNGYNIQEGGSEPPHYCGDEHSNTRISDKDVELLKKDLAETTISLSELGDKYGISKKQVLRINQGISREKIGESYPIRKIPNLNGKLSDEDVDMIIELLKTTYRFVGDIARQFNVGVGAIDKINKGVFHRRENEIYPIRNWKSSGVIVFTYEQVTEIINLLQNTNISINSIAKKYNVNFNSVAIINQGTSKKYRRDNLQYPLRPY